MGNRVLKKLCSKQRKYSDAPMSWSFFVFASLGLGIWLATGQANVRAQDVSRIAAIVNDDIISILDLSARIDLTIFAANYPNTVVTRRRLADQMLRSLIDEKLQLQEARSRGIRVSKREIDIQLSEIERQNNVARGGLNDLLERRGIKKSSLVEQLRARAAWIKTVKRKFRRQITVSDEEIDDELDRMAFIQGQVQYRVAEILLTFDSPEQEKKIRSEATRLTQQIRNGARYDALARQFSQSASAVAGGDLGWITQGQLDTALEEALKELTPGQVSDPVRTYAGYHVLILRDQRTPQDQKQNTVLDLQQIVIPIKTDAANTEIEKQRIVAQNMRTSLKSCDDISTVAKSIVSPMSGSLGRIVIKDLPKKLQNAVISLKVGDVSAPIVTSNAVLLLMVCDLEEPSAELPSREQIQTRLSFQKLDLLGRRYLRDLRRSAFVEYRI